MSDFELTPEILEQFITETRENIGHAEAALLQLEKSNAAGEAIHELFRAIHTIKGSADYLGFKDLKELSHAFENNLDQLRTLDNVSISAEQFNVFFDVLDVIANLVASAPHTPEWYIELCKYSIKKLNTFTVPVLGSAGIAIKTNDSSASQSIDASKSNKIFSDTIEQQCGVLLLAQKKLQVDGLICVDVRGMILRAIQCICNASQFVGEEELYSVSGNLKKWLLVLNESNSSSEIILKIESYLVTIQAALSNNSGRLEKKEIVVDNINTTPVKNVDLVLLDDETKQDHKLLNPSELNKFMDSKSVRVDQDVLDGFMNLVGELIVARNGFAHIHSKLLGNKEERLVAMKEFRESSNRLHQISGELQRNVMEMRMLPIKTLFQRYPIIVRDVCRKTEKKVEVSFEGEETEIDKGIADQISESLIHIVRNAVGHGIESPEERRQTGKVETGTLIMKASHQGNFIVIEVTDDGGGINIEKIRSKVIERGLLTLNQARNSSKSELLDYIFTPGFSTAASTTDISGRGVGLDVVMTNLRKIKGNVSVTTEINQGTCFRLEVPLTMAIMRALLVKSGHAIYAISLQDVNETVKVRSDELKSIRQKMAITLRGEVIMVEWLSLILGHSVHQEISPDVRLPILILQVNGNKFGIIVDSVFRQEEIVVKPLPETYAIVPGLAGASILGDGKAILILDSNQLYGLMAGKNFALEEIEDEACTVWCEVAKPQAI